MNPLTAPRPRHRRPFLLALLLALLLPTASAWAQDTPVVVGSKKFTEGVLLGEIATQRLAAAGLAARHRDQLGGTRVLWNALLAGDIDVYAEYTGTLHEEILAGEAVPPEGLAAALAAQGVRMTAPLGFNNTYALGMTEPRAAALGIETISDLRGHPGLVLGFSNEFLDRGDGWPALRTRYGLPHTRPRGLDHDLAYRGIEAGSIDVIDLYSTDAEIAHYGLRVLRDDLRHFPTYQALYLYRADLADRAPEAVGLLEALAGSIDEATMVRLNARARIDRVPEPRVATDFLNEAFVLDTPLQADIQTPTERVMQRTGEHLLLVGVSLLAAILLGLPLGILAARRERLGTVILGTVGVIYTIPSLALLVFMIPLLGIGAVPAMVALFLYSLLPIVRNTHAGLTDIARPLLESAEALGLSPGAQLRRVELPLATRSILAGIQTAAVINVGTATLGALIGAGGYGQPILTGIRLGDTALILEGAVPAALLALGVQAAFTLAERHLLPAGLRAAG